MNLAVYFDLVAALFFNLTLTDSTTFIEKMSGGSRFSAIYMPDYDNVDVTFGFTHFLNVLISRTLVNE